MHTTQSPSNVGVREGKGAPCRVLLVDDQPFFLAFARDLLTPAGYDVQTASGGAEALKVAEAGRPDAILLDVEMPGMDGFETCRRLKSNRATAGIPVVVLTTTLDARVKERALEAGAAAAFVKALSPDRLRVILDAVLATVRSQGRGVGEGAGPKN